MSRAFPIYYANGDESDPARHQVFRQSVQDRADTAQQMAELRLKVEAHDRTIACLEAAVQNLDRAFVVIMTQGHQDLNQRYDVQDRADTPQQMAELRLKVEAQDRTNARLEAAVQNLDRAFVVIMAQRAPQDLNQTLLTPSSQPAVAIMSAPSATEPVRGPTLSALISKIEGYAGNNIAAQDLLNELQTMLDGTPHFQRVAALNTAVFNSLSSKGRLLSFLKNLPHT